MKIKRLLLINLILSFVFTIISCGDDSGGDGGTQDIIDVGKDNVEVDTDGDVTIDREGDVDIDTGCTGCEGEDRKCYNINESIIRIDSCKKCIETEGRAQWVDGCPYDNETCIPVGEILPNYTRTRCSKCVLNDEGRPEVKEGCSFFDPLNSHPNQPLNYCLLPGESVPPSANYPCSICLEVPPGSSQLELFIGCWDNTSSYCTPQNEIININQEPCLICECRLQNDGSYVCTPQYGCDTIVEDTPTDFIDGPVDAVEILNKGGNIEGVDLYITPGVDNHGYIKPTINSDLDNDGDLEIGWHGSIPNNQITGSQLQIFLGNDYTNYTTILTNKFVTGIITSDLTFEGKSDLIIEYTDPRTRQGGIEFYCGLGPSNGNPITFVTCGNIPIMDNIYGIDLFDFDHNGWLDIIIAGYDSNSYIYKGQPPSCNGGDCIPQFNTNTPMPLQINGSLAVKSGDLDYNGSTEIIFAKFVNREGMIEPSFATYSPIFYRGDPSTPNLLSFQLEVAGATDVTLADVNGDRFLDIIFANYCLGGITPGGDLDPYSIECMIDTIIYSYIYLNVDELNQTGNLIPLSERFSNEECPTVGRTKQCRIKLQTGSTYAVTAADYDLDGCTDLAFATRTSLKVYRNGLDAQGNCALFNSNPLELNVTDTGQIRKLLSGDFDENGYPDIAVTVYSERSPEQQVIFFNQGIINNQLNLQKQPIVSLLTSSSMTNYRTGNIVDNYPLGFYLSPIISMGDKVKWVKFKWYGEGELCFRFRTEDTPTNFLRIFENWFPAQGQQLCLNSGEEVNLTSLGLNYNGLYFVYMIEFPLNTSYYVDKVELYFVP